MWDKAPRRTASIDKDTMTSRHPNRANASRGWYGRYQNVDNAAE